MLPPEVQRLILFVRYEDLWSELETGLRRVSSHLFPSNSSVAQFFFEAALKNNKKWAMVYGNSPINSSNAAMRKMRRGTPGQWRAELNEDHLELIRHTHVAALIKRFGYDEPARDRHHRNVSFDLGLLTEADTCVQNHRRKLNLSDLILDATNNRNPYPKKKNVYPRPALCLWSKSLIAAGRRS